ncbi:MAG: hypothetical protein WCS93_06840 [Candidatus Delongbacteria bacterium]
MNKQTNKYIIIIILLFIINIIIWYNPIVQYYDNKINKEQEESIETKKADIIIEKHVEEAEEKTKQKIIEENKKKEDKQKALENSLECSKQANNFLTPSLLKFWFKRDTSRIVITNHYNNKLQKCFIRLVTISTFDDVLSLEYLFDVYEKKQYGMFYWLDNPDIITCNVAGKTCENYKEFDKLVNIYMNE